LYDRLIAGDGISEMTDSEIRSASAYGDYLENGITDETLRAYVIYKANDPSRCE